MFPLGTVVFPHSAVPLRVFEPRYQVLLDAVLEEGGSFGTVLIERGFEVGGGDVRCGVGTRLQVLAHQDLEDGHRAIVAGGVERIRVVEWLDDDPHPWALVEPSPDEDEGIEELRPQVSARLERLLAMASELGADTAGVDLTVDGDATTVSFQLASVIPVTPIDAQALLEACGPGTRLERALEMLDDQIELIRLCLSGS